MSVTKEINEFEFESINSLDADIIKNGFYEYNRLVPEGEASDQWSDNVSALELILENENNQPETLHDILDLLEPLKNVTHTDVSPIFNVKRMDEVLSYYHEDPFLVSIIEVLEKNVDERLEIDDFLSELIDLCQIISDIT